MTKQSIIREIREIREKVEALITESPQLLGETPTACEISSYASAISDLDRVLRVLDIAVLDLNGNGN